MYTDPGGNFITIDIDTLNRNILLVNMYGPNRDSPEFYVELQQRITQSGMTDVIIAGDWNLVMNPALDYDNYKHINNKKAQRTVIQMIDDLELTDVWRDPNPEYRRYTWRRTNPLQQSRLDLFLVSNSLMNIVGGADIISGYRSDHSIIPLDLNAISLIEK